MTQEQETRLKEIGVRVEDVRIMVAAHEPLRRSDGSVFSSCDIQFLYDILLQTIAEIAEARKLCSDYRDTYGGGPKDPLPWEAKDV